MSQRLEHTEALFMFLSGELWILGQRVNGPDGGATGGRGEAAEKRRC